MNAFYYTSKNSTSSYNLLSFSFYTVADFFCPLQSLCLKHVELSGVIYFLITASRIQEKVERICCDLSRQTSTPGHISCKRKRLNVHAGSARWANYSKAGDWMGKMRKKISLDRFENIRQHFCFDIAHHKNGYKLYYFAG